MSDPIIPVPAIVKPKPYTMIVEDEKPLREMYGWILSDEGIPHILCANGQEAIEHFEKKERTIDVLITDIDMPIMDGTTLVRRIKSEQLDGTTRKYLISGRMDAYKNLAEEFIRMGIIHGYAAKPFEIERLLQIVYKG